MWMGWFFAVGLFDTPPQSSKGNPICVKISRRIGQISFNNVHEKATSKSEPQSSITRHIRRKEKFTTKKKLFSFAHAYPIMYQIKSLEKMDERDFGIWFLYSTGCKPFNNIKMSRFAFTIKIMSLVTRTSNEALKSTH